MVSETPSVVRISVCPPVVHHAPSALRSERVRVRSIRQTLNTAKSGVWRELEPLAMDISKASCAHHSLRCSSLEGVKFVSRSGAQQSNV